MEAQGERWAGRYQCWILSLGWGEEANQLL